MFVAFIDKDPREDTFYWEKRTAFSIYTCIKLFRQSCLLFNLSGHIHTEGIVRTEQGSMPFLFSMKLVAPYSNSCLCTVNKQGSKVPVYAKLFMWRFKYKKCAMLMCLIIDDNKGVIPHVMQLNFIPCKTENSTLQLWDKTAWYYYRLHKSF